MTLAEFLALDAAARREHLASLTPEDRAAFLGELEAEFDRLDAEPATPEILAAQATVADAIDETREVTAEADQAQAAVEAQREELRSRRAAASAEGDQGGDGDGDEGDAGDEGDGEGDGDAGDLETHAPGQEPVAPEAVAASARRTGTRRTTGAPMRAMGTRRPAAAAPAARPATARASLVAAADVEGFVAGSPITSSEDLGRAIMARLDSLQDGGSPGRYTAATVQVDYPAERRLRRGDVFGNTERIDAVASEEALVAAGGLCQPLNLDYDVPVVGNTDRPVRDALARFGAERGGIRFIAPIGLTPGTPGAAQGVGVWTAAADDSVTFNADGTVATPAAAARKPIVEYDCPDDSEEFVAAVTLRQRFSNFTARFNPEVVAAHAQIGMINHARLADLRLLEGIRTRSTQVTTARVLGAARDLFANLDLAVAAMRYRTRTDAQGLRLRAVLPGWVRDMVRADFVRQMPAGNPDEVFALADARLTAWFAARGVVPVWTLEDITPAFGAQAPIDEGTPGSGTLLGWPDTVEWALFPEGSFLFLDGGTLDVGVVRDSQLNSVNRYETFYETFEGVANRGTESLWLRSTFEPTGAAAGLVDTNATDF